MTSEQPAAIYLPPSYGAGEKRFPVVYFLPGFGSYVHYFTAWRVWQGFGLRESMDELIASGAVKEMIVVIPNGQTPVSGCFYVDSPVLGNWEQFITDDLVAYVDATYRTRPSPDARGLAGHSMGGFGALNLGIRHPDVFGVVYALSPGVFAPGALVHHEMVADHRIAERILSKAEELSAQPRCTATSASLGWVSHLVDSQEIQTVFALAYGAAFSADPAQHPPHVALPYHRSGKAIEVDEVALSRYEAGFGGWPAKLAIYSAGAARLRAIAFDYGTGDEHPWIPEGCRYLSRLLTEGGIPHTAQEYDGTHTGRLRERLERHMLPFLSLHLG